MSLFGWTLCAIGIFALLVLLITSGDIKDWLDGAGGRRITRRGQLARQRDEIAELKQQIADCPHCTPPAPSFPTVEEIADSDRSDQTRTINAPAPVDNGCRDTPLAAAQTARDTFLDQIARPGEEGMLAALKATAQQPLRQAAPDADTVTLPAVTTVKPLHEARQELEAWAVGTAPGPLSSATSIPRGVGDTASVKVQLALNEAP